MSGQFLLQFPVTQRKTLLNVKGFSPGLYVIEVMDEKSVQRSSIVIGR